MKLGEALLYLQAGQKIRCECWKPDEFIEFDGSEIFSETSERLDKINVGAWMVRDDWEVYDR